MAFAEPMLAKPVAELPECGKWQYEIKLDGYRALASAFSAPCCMTRISHASCVIALRQQRPFSNKLVHQPHIGA